MCEKGELEAKDKMVHEHVTNIDRWTGSFLKFVDVYIQRHADRALELVQYMFIIRDAARKFPCMGWRNYNEQFRVRRAISYQNWSKLNADLWLRLIAGRKKTSSSAGTNTSWFLF